MDILIPKTVTLTASSIAESSDTEWSGATTYALNDIVKVSTALPTSSKTYRYKSLAAGNLNHSPATNATWWLNLGASERWQAFDDKIKTASAATSPLTFSVTAAYGTAVIMMGLDATTVRCVVVNNGTAQTTLDKTWTLGGRKDITFDIPNAASQTISITVTGTGTVSIGLFRVCTPYDIGQTMLGAGARIVSYSRKETDLDTGVTELIRGNVSKAFAATLRVPAADVNLVFRRMAAYDGIPVGFRDGVTAESASTDREPFIIYGWYGEFEAVEESTTYSLCSLEAYGII